MIQVKNRFYYSVIKTSQCGYASAGWVFWNKFFLFQVSEICFPLLLLPQCEWSGEKRGKWLLKVQLIISQQNYKLEKKKQFHIRQGVEKSVSHTHKHRCVLAMLALLIAAQDSTGSSQVFKFLKSLQKKLVCNGHTLREERPIMAFHWLYLAFICELNGCTWRWEFSSHSSIWL